MNIIEELEKASKEAAETGLEMLRKSQMGFDFDGTTHDHHVAYTRTNAAGTVSQVKQKGMAPTPIAKKFQTGPGETYHKGDKARYTGETDVVGGKMFYEIQMMEGHEKGKTRFISKTPMAGDELEGAKIAPPVQQPVDAGPKDMPNDRGFKTGDKVQYFDPDRGTTTKHTVTGIRAQEVQLDGGYYYEDSTVMKLEGHKPTPKPAAQATAPPQVTELRVKVPKAAQTDMETAHNIAQEAVAALKAGNLPDAGVYIIEYEGRKPVIQITTGQTGRDDETKEMDEFARGWWRNNANRIRKETGIMVELSGSIGMDSKGVTTVKEPGHYGDHVRDIAAEREERSGSSRGLDAMHGRGTGNGGSGTAWR